MVNNIAKECFSKSILLLTIANLRTSFFSDGRKERITIKIQWTCFLSWDISQDSSLPKPIVVTCVQKTSFSHLLPKKTIESPLEFNHPSSHLRPPHDTSKIVTSSRGSVDDFQSTTYEKSKKVTFRTFWTTIPNPSWAPESRSETKCTRLNCILAPRFYPLGLAGRRPALALCHKLSRRLKISEANQGKNCKSYQAVNNW